MKLHIKYQRHGSSVFRQEMFYVPGSEAGTYCFCPVCLLICWFVGWTTLTLVITFEPFETEPLFLASRFLVTRASHL